MSQTKYIRKIILMLILFLLANIGLAGCRQNNTDINLGNSENDELKMDLMLEKPDFESFFNLQECIIENDFETESGKDDVSYFLNANGKYDLNQDGKKDSIEIRLLGREESSIKINKSEISIYCDHPFDFYLVNLVKDDRFIEIAIYDDGPSADPVTTFYRYDGKNIYELGSFHTDINVEDTVNTYYGNILADGRGNFISPGSIVKFVYPNIIKGYHSIDKNEFIYKSIDYIKYLGEEYSIATDFDAFFIEQNLRDDLNSQDIEFKWDFEKMVEFKKDEKIRILMHDEFWYGIECEDGVTGILYFWIGD